MSKDQFMSTVQSVFPNIQLPATRVDQITRTMLVLDLMQVAGIRFVCNGGDWTYYKGDKCFGDYTLQACVSKCNNV